MKWNVTVNGQVRETCRNFLAAMIYQSEFLWKERHEIGKIEPVFDN